MPSTLPLAPAVACDCDHCPFYRGDPSRGVLPGPEPVCSGCNTRCGYCGCARTSTRVSSGSPCAQCPIRCGSRTDMATWMADVGGTFGFEDLQVRAPIPAGLPAFVPMLDGAASVAELDLDLHWPAYAVGFTRVVSRITARVKPRFSRQTARQALGLRADQLAVLVGYGEDPLVEAFWTHRSELIPAVAAQGWDLVLSPNYSMYWNQPRAEHLLNFRRNLLIAAELAEAGVPAVPNLYWYRLEDLERYVSWAAVTKPAAVAVNLQTCRTAPDWDLVALPGLAYLAMGLPPEVTVVLNGVSRPDRIATVVEFFAGRRLHVISQHALQAARHGMTMTPSGRVSRQARVQDLFTASVRSYATMVEAGHG